MVRKAVAACGLVTAATAASLIGTSPAFAQQGTASGVRHRPMIDAPPASDSSSADRGRSATSTRPFQSGRSIILQQHPGGIAEEPIIAPPIIIPGIPIAAPPARPTVLDMQIMREQLKAEEEATAFQNRRQIEEMKSQETQARLDREQLEAEMKSKENLTHLENEKILEDMRNQGQQPGGVVFEARHSSEPRALRGESSDERQTVQAPSSKKHQALRSQGSEEEEVER